MALRKDIVKTVILVTVAALWLLFLYRIRMIITPFISALVLAYLLAPAVRFFERNGKGGRKGLPRGLAVAIVYLAVILIIIAVYNVIVPRLVTEVLRLAENLPGYVDQTEALIQDLQLRYQLAGIPDSVRQAIDQSVAKLSSSLLGYGTALLQGGAGFISGLVKFFLAWILAIYLLLDWEKIGKRLADLVPRSYQGTVKETAEESGRVLGSYIRGLLLVAAIVGTLSGLTVFVAGLRFSLVFGLLSAVGQLIPYFGPFFAAAPPIIMALLRSPALGLKVAIAYIVIQQVESNFISPRLIGKRLGIHPLVLIFSLLAGQALFGLSGMLIAAPVAGIINVLFQNIKEYDTRRRSGKTVTPVAKPPDDAKK